MPEILNAKYRYFAAGLVDQPFLRQNLEQTVKLVPWIEAARDRDRLDLCVRDGCLLCLPEPSQKRRSFRGFVYGRKLIRSVRVHHELTTVMNYPRPSYLLFFRDGHL